MIPAVAPNFVGRLPRLPFTTPPFLSDNSRFRPCGHGPHQGSWPGVAGNGPIRHRARGAPCPGGSLCTFLHRDVARADQGSAPGCRSASSRDEQTAGR